MNCQDITRIIDSGKFSDLGRDDLRDAEAHAKSCRHCAPLWIMHASVAATQPPAMPRELAAACQTLVAARAQGNVLRFARRTLVLASGFVVLAAAAAVVTVKYVAPALLRADVPAPQPEPVVVAALPAPVPPPPSPPPPVDPVPSIQQGEPDMNKPASIAVTIAALGTAAAAQTQTAPPPGGIQRISAEQVVASNDLNKDGIVTREEATEAKKSLIVIWNMYDMDRDGRVDVEEIRRATNDVAVGNATQKITGETGGHKSMPNPLEIIATNDQDGDRIVTKEEAIKANKSLAGLWDTFDIDKDGKVDAAEIAKASGY